MTCAWVILGVSLLMLAPLGVPVHPQTRASEVRIRHPEPLQDWVAAVGRHTPGELDAALLTVGRWDAGELQDGWVGVNVLNLLLHDPAHRRFTVMLHGVRFPVDVSRAQLSALRTTAEHIRQTVGADAFRKRAAVLHTDAVLLLTRDPTAVPVYSSFLLPQHLVMRSGDGQQSALHGGDVNWEFARILLESVTDAGSDPDVRLWFEATLRHKLWEERLDSPHFDQAVRLFPRDRVILTLNGVLHEAFADARVQAAVEDARLPPGVRLEVTSQESHLGRAEAFLRRAVAVDNGDAEAQVRLGRTLSLLGRHAEAATILRAVPNVGDAALFYYGQLFLGSAEEAVGQFDSARLAYAKAIAVYPRAQAPRLALSQLAHRLGDRQTAREALAPLLAASMRTLSDDPLWSYRLMPGRRAHEMMHAVYRALSSPR